MAVPTGNLQVNSYHVKTFGCQMNLHDSEHLAGVMEESGYVEQPDIGLADVLIFNTCMVRKSAEEKAWGWIQAQASLNPDAIIAVCGCMAEHYGVDIMSRCPGVDLVFGLDSMGRLPDMIDKCASNRLCDIGNVNLARIDNLPTRRASKSAAWVPVSHGCDKFCSYCIVPLVRGRERSRPLKEIIEESVELAEDGVFEITLLGQNVNSYCGAPKATFAEVLSAVAGVPGIERVKFETSHPSDLSESILRVMSETAEVCEHLHLPVQSGSNRILKAMGRGYDRKQYMRLIDVARKVIPDLILSTDIIVGFPGETDNDFDETMDLVRAVGFDAAFMFIYSRREGTAAASMGGVVPAEICGERLKELIPNGYSGAVYTQTTDVEVEVNGLMTYDRKVVKLEEERIHRVNREICTILKK